MSQVCAYCGAPATTRDHLIPKIRGVNLGPGNIVPACRLCNQLKGSMTPAAMVQLADDTEALTIRLRLIADRAGRLLAERGLDAFLRTALQNDGEGV